MSRDKFWWVVHKNPGNGCWVWLGAWSRTDGYGKYTIVDESRDCGTRSTSAHQYAWEQLVGPVTKGMQLDHTCRVKLCVRPDHLEEVTHLENHKRRILWKCKRGHLQTPENRYTWTANGRRRERCKPCIPIQRELWLKKRKNVR